MISELCIFNIESGQVSVHFRADWHLEAPNWSPDGSELIFNADGRLYRIATTAHAQPQLIDTGFAQACNNDHGISPDGTLLVISDKTETGVSTIYTLPYGGGRPHQITTQTPSYWHGWSPDGARLAYVGRRNGGAFQVYTIAVDGGPEFQVTHDFDHCDGPDYTPDGRWIWFNGERDGHVNLWRISPDGSDLQQMTHDRFVNWFPHPSPDCESILYLAYPEGTLGHPANLPVALRLMPADAGSGPVTLTEFRGGQGSINVPCWSPDSRSFAFVRYPDG